MPDFDLFERLADVEVPPPPPQLDREVHSRVNRLLVVMHFSDLAVRGVGYAFAQFFRPFVHLLIFSVTRKLPPVTRSSEGDASSPPGGSTS